MIQKILSISGRPGLFKLVNQGRNMLIVESLADGKRTPAYSHDKVVAIADISIYTNDDEERPLVKVLETIRDKNDSKPVDVKGLGSDADLRKYFETILPQSIQLVQLSRRSRHHRLLSARTGRSQRRGL